MKITMFLIVIMILTTIAAYRDPYVTIPEEVEVKAGETAHIEVKIKHVQTTMWQLKVYVDTSQIESRFLSIMDISADEENPVQFEEEIPFGTEITATIDIAVAMDSSSGQVTIPIIAAGNKGPCLKGCEPFLVQKSTVLAIKKQSPRLALLLPESQVEVTQGGSATVEIQLKNYGAATAYVENLEAVPEGEIIHNMQTVPRKVDPGATESVFLFISTKDVPPGTYLIQVKLEYKDEVQNSFQDSKTIYLTIAEKESPPESTSPPVSSTAPPTPEADNSDSDAKYQYFAAGLFTGASIFGAAVMMGLFLKKRRPAT